MHQHTTDLPLAQPPSRINAPRPLWTRRLWLAFAALSFLGIVAISAPFAWSNWLEARYEPSIYTVSEYTASEVPEARVAIVFGARVYPNGQLSGMLRDRVETAVQLYEAGTVDKLLLTGDNSVVEYNEPDAMVAYALARGVPAEDVQPDYAGRRTYDSCYRARHIFGVESAVLVTQRFHLPRAIFLCQRLGVDSTGAAADLRPYDPRSVRYSETREVLARTLALFDAIRLAPPAILGDPIEL